MPSNRVELGELEYKTRNLNVGGILYEGKYTVCKDAEVFSLNFRGQGEIKKLKPRPGRSGYLTLTINGRTKYLHRVVAECYCENPENKPQVNHKDGNILNNKASNLEWVTQGENFSHSVAEGKRVIQDRVKSFAYNAYKEQFEDDQFEFHWDVYNATEAFSADGNIFEAGNDEFTEEAHFIMRKVAEFHMIDVLKALKITFDDNIKETPKRIIKVLAGDSLECDTELGGGRFSKPVRIPTFPNTRGNDNWISKEVRIVATCSHHFLPFTGKALISYKPNNFVLGISKLQRLANYVANRFWLQEDLTKAIHTAVKEAAQVSDADVKVEIIAQHSCEKDRGVKNLDCNFITNE